MDNIFYNVYKKYENLIYDFKTLNHFVETGTHLGQTAKSWSKIFKKVDTIELYKEGQCHYGEVDLFTYHEEIKKECPNINFVYGDSGNKLLELIKEEK